MSFEKPGGLHRRDFLKALGIGVAGALTDVPGSVFGEDATARNTEDVRIVEKIRSWIEFDSEKYSVRRELRDADGVYVLELELAGVHPGETIEYSYQRKGSWGNNSSLTTRIDVTHFIDGVPVGGEHIATYSEKLGRWEKA